MDAGTRHEESAMALADSWSDGDDTDCDYYDTPSGNVWCPGDEPSQPPPGLPAQAAYRGY